MPVRLRTVPLRIGLVLLAVALTGVPRGGGAEPKEPSVESPAPLVSLDAFADPDGIVGILALAALSAMLLAVQATRPSVRACVIEAIGKNAAARAARARARGQH